MFHKIYTSMLRAAASPKAEPWLYTLSFCESSFFPIPPDVMLAPMCAVTPHRALRFAALTTLFSVLGGFFGYIIGFFLFDWIQPWLATTAYWDDFLTAEKWFDKWGVWVVLVAAFSPVPYKMFTISAGVMAQNLLAFGLTSLVGRGARFMLVALLLRWLGPKILPHIGRWVNAIGWATVAALAVAIVIAALTGE